MTAEAEKPPFAETWAMLGAAVDLAGKIVEADPAELVAIIKAGRLGMGTSGEQALLTAMRAIHIGAVAQVELADAAIAVIAGCSNLANEAALATIGPGERAATQAAGHCQ
jgi:hypothetical protein